MGLSLTLRFSRLAAACAYPVINMYLAMQSHDASGETYLFRRRDLGSHCWMVEKIGESVKKQCNEVL